MATAWGATTASTSFMFGARTTIIFFGFNCSAVPMICLIIGTPAIECITFDIADFMRVPLPAAKITTAKSLAGTGEREEEISVMVVLAKLLIFKMILP